MGRRKIDLLLELGSQLESARDIIQRMKEKNWKTDPALGETLGTLVYVALRDVIRETKAQIALPDRPKRRINKTSAKVLKLIP